MTHQDFDREISRLESQWRGGYGQERREILWTAFKDCPEMDFHDAVSECLANLRGAPLLEDLSKAVESAKTRRISNHYSSGMGSGSFVDTLNDAAKANQTTDPEFVKACTKLLSDRLAGRITYTQFLEGCDLLDAAADQISPQTKRRPVTRGYLATSRTINKGVKDD